MKLSFLKCSFSDPNDPKLKQVLNTIRELDYLSKCIKGVSFTRNKFKESSPNNFSCLESNRDLTQLGGTLSKDILDLAVHSRLRHQLSIFDSLYSKPYLRADIRKKLLKGSQTLHEENVDLPIDQIIHVPFSEEETKFVFETIINQLHLQASFNITHVSVIHFATFLFCRCFFPHFLKNIFPVHRCRLFARKMLSRRFKVSD